MTLFRVPICFLHSVVAPVVFVLEKFEILCTSKWGVRHWSVNTRLDCSRNKISLAMLNFDRIFWESYPPNSHWEFVGVSRWVSWETFFLFVDYRCQRTPSFELCLQVLLIERSDGTSFLPLSLQLDPLFILVDMLFVLKQGCFHPHFSCSCDEE